MVLSRGAAWQLGLGLSIGMVGAMGISQLLRGVLVGTNAIDPTIRGAVAVVLVIVGLSACLIPVRRALRLDPASVLRTD